MVWKKSATKATTFVNNVYASGGGRSGGVTVDSSLPAFCDKCGMGCKGHYNKTSCKVFVNKNLNVAKLLENFPFAINKPHDQSKEWQLAYNFRTPR